MITEIGALFGSSGQIIFKMWEVTVDPGIRFIREHRHINFEISLILSGNGIYYTSKGSQEIQEGDIYVFTSNEPHCITMVGKYGLRMLNIQFSEHFIKNIKPLYSNFPYVFFNHSGKFPIRIKNPQGQMIADKLFTIRNEITERAVGYQCTVNTAVSDIIIDLIRNHRLNDNILSATGSMKRLEPGIKYINEHFTENISLEDIAGQANITPNYYSSLFKECLNIKLWDYVTGKRVELAAELLKNDNNNMNILDIAVNCGFNNTANFNRSFRAYTGMTPSQYRRNHGDIIL